MNLPVTEYEPDDRPKAAMRFTYPSGSRPLDGYTIKRGVGRGGFGEVYFAISDAGKEVALKLIRRNLDVEVRGVTQCLNLKHPNLIDLYDIRTDENDDRWVVMEYVSGESLEDVVERNPEGMPTDEVLHWFTGMAAGVAYLHDHGIVHRDLKPANIFIDQGTVKIGDYGLSKFISCSRRSGQTESVGTVHYMAPEIANGRYGKEIDTYALGIILYEMLTGHVPFEGESVGEVLMKHLTAEPDLSALAEPYRGLVKSAMAKDPEARFNNVAEMIQRLPASVATASFRQPAGGANGAQFVPMAFDTDEPAAAQRRRSDEPIMASLQDGWYQAKARFQESNMHPLLKSVILFVIVIGLVGLSPEWLPFVMVGGFCYLVYRAIRTIVLEPNAASSSLTPSQQRASAAAADSLESPARRRMKVPPFVGAPVRQTGRKRRQSWQQHLRHHLATRPLRERVQELLGGMLLAAGVSAIASLLVSLIFTNTMQLEFYAWMMLTTMLAAWAVMIPAKLAEGRVEDQAPLRFTQLVLGALVGLLSWTIASKLMLTLPVWPDAGVSPQDTAARALYHGLNDKTFAESFKAGAVEFPLQIFTGYFAFLFVLLAWWRNAECSRASRVSVWAIVWCALVAWMLHFVWWFPQPIGFLVAGATAFTVQLASPWMPPSQRRALVEAEA